MIDVLILQERHKEFIVEDEKCKIFSDNFIKEKGINFEYFIPFDEATLKSVIELPEDVYLYMLHILTVYYKSIVYQTPSSFILSTLLNKEDNVSSKINNRDVNTFIDIVNTTVELRAYKLTFNEVDLSNIIFSIWKSARDKTGNQLNCIDYFVSLYSEIIMNEQLGFPYNITSFEKAAIAFSKLSDGTTLFHLIANLIYTGQYLEDEFTVLIGSLVDGMSKELDLNVTEEMLFKSVHTGNKYAKELNLWG